MLQLGDDNLRASFAALLGETLPPQWREKVAAYLIKSLKVDATNFKGAGLA